MLTTPLELKFRGTIPTYIDNAFREAAAKGNSFPSWQLDQKTKLTEWHASLQEEQKLHEKTVLETDPDLGPMNTRIQLPFMLKCMKTMGFSAHTQHSIKKG